MKEDELDMKNMNEVPKSKKSVEENKEEFKSLEPKSKKVLRDITPSFREKIKRISNIKEEKVVALKQTHPDWNEEIAELSDKELIDRIDNDHSWQYSYVVLCCLEYNKRLSAKKTKK